MKTFRIIDAIPSLYPQAEWSLEGDSYDGLNWISKDIKKPSKSEIEKEVKRLQEEYDYLEYQRLRSAEYPDFKDYLDGIVKGNQEQIDKYIADCLAVKEKYPKPE